jgi:hypothetical protein
MRHHNIINAVKLDFLRSSLIQFELTIQFEVLNKILTWLQVLFKSVYYAPFVEEWVYCFAKLKDGRYVCPSVVIVTVLADYLKNFLSENLHI